MKLSKLIAIPGLALAAALTQPTFAQPIDDPVAASFARDLNREPTETAPWHVKVEYTQALFSATPGGAVLRIAAEEGLPAGQIRYFDRNEIGESLQALMTARQRSTVASADRHYDQTEVGGSLEQILDAQRKSAPTFAQQTNDPVMASFDRGFEAREIIQLPQFAAREADMLQRLVNLAYWGTEFEKILLAHASTQ